MKTVGPKPKPKPAVVDVLEIYKLYRPRTLSEVVGQEAVVSQVSAWIKGGKTPHTIGLFGPTGAGKTTIGRIIRQQLKCGDADFIECDAADDKGIDMVRTLKEYIGRRPMDGACRVWLVDESHKLTTAAQSALLKILEDTPRHVYFMLATNEPQKLLATVRGRCSELKFSPISPRAMDAILVDVIGQEGFKVSQVVIDEIIEAAEGSARKALVILDQVADLGTEEAQLAAVQTSSGNKEAAINLCRVLIRPNCQWAEVAKILKELEDDPERIRYMVLGYFNTVLLGGGKLALRAFAIMEIFSRNFYDSKKAGLTAACYEVFLKAPK